MVQRRFGSTRKFSGPSETVRYVIPKIYYYYYYYPGWEEKTVMGWEYFWNPEFLDFLYFRNSGVLVFGMFTFLELLIYTCEDLCIFDFCTTGFHTEDWRMQECFKN